MVSPNVGVPFHRPTSAPFGAPPSKGRREKERRICAANESTLSTADAVPLPHAGKAYMVAASPPFLEEGILVSQPSPLGEGAPQGRIGHRRYERQMRKAEKCAAHEGEARDPDRESQRLNQCFLKNHSRPFPLEVADERSEAGLASANVGVAFHAANLRPFFLPPSKGRREKKGAACIVIGIFAAKPPPEP